MPSLRMSRLFLAMDGPRASPKVNATESPMIISRAGAPGASGGRVTFTAAGTVVAEEWDDFGGSVNGPPPAAPSEATAAGTRDRFEDSVVANRMAAAVAAIAGRTMPARQPGKRRPTRIGCSMIQAEITAGPIEEAMRAPSSSVPRSPVRALVRTKKSGQCQRYTPYETRPRALSGQND